jgi:hypothetical protein
MSECDILVTFFVYALSWVMVIWGELSIAEEPECYLTSFLGNLERKSVE